MTFAKTIQFAKQKAAGIKRIGKDSSAVAMVEFAFTAPIVLSLGLMGAETANYTVAHMQISQVAMQVADNASRVGDTELAARRVYEADINSTFVGAEKLGGRFEIYERGRIIISSLQVNAEDGQWIAWQRCRGAKNHPSSYGVQGDGETGTDFPGMGKTGKELKAAPGTAVMFVEISYTYRALTPFDYLDGKELNYTAAFNVRDTRDLTKLHQTNPAAPVASCSIFSAARPS